MAKIISLIGKPGTGKSTLARHLESYMGWSRISTGEILRQEALKSKTIKYLLDKGEYIPTSIMYGIVVDKLKQTVLPEKSGQNIVFDGFPRTADQCGMIEAIIENNKLPVDFYGVVRLTNISNEELFNRVSKRLVCSDPKCGKVYAAEENRSECSCGNKLVPREDDSFELFSKRMSIFEFYELKLVAYYKHKHRLYDLNAKSSTEFLANNVQILLWAATSKDIFAHI